MILLLPFWQLQLVGQAMVTKGIGLAADGSGLKLLAIANDGKEKARNYIDEDSVLGVVKLN